MYSLRTRILLPLAVVGFGTGALLTGVLSTALDMGTTAMEQQELELARGRLEATLRAEGRSLGQLGVGLSSREGLSLFLRDRSLLDVEASVTARELDRSGVDLISILSESGNRLIARQLKSDLLVDVELDPSSGPLSVKGYGLWKDELGGEWWVLGSSAIPPISLGAPGGTLVVGRKVTPQMVLDWQNRAGASLVLEPGDHVQDVSTLWADFEMTTLSATPLEMRVILPRPLPGWSSTLLRYVAASVGLIWAIMLVGAGLLMDQILLKPVKESESRIRTLALALGVAPDAERDQNEIQRLTATLASTMHAASNAREELSRVNRRVWTLLDSLPAAVAFKDMRLRYTSVNRRFADMLGRAPHAVEGRRDEELFGPAVATRLAEEDQQIVHTGMPVMLPFFNLEGGTNTGARNRTHTLHKVPLRDSHGKMTGILCILVETTEQQRAEEAALGRARLLATATRDIRETIDMLLGTALLLKGQSEDQPADPVMTELLETIETGARSTLNTLENLQAYAQLESQLEKPAVHPALFPLQAVIDAVIASHRTLARTRSISLEVSLDKQLPIEVFGVQNYLTRVLDNLLANAVRHSPEGGSVQLFAELEDSGDTTEDTTRPVWLRFEVHDSGPRIPDEQVAGIFRPGIWNLDQANHQDLGLGLPMAYHFVRLSGGQLRLVDAGAPSGCCFRVRIPFSLVPMTEDGLLDMSAAGLDEMGFEEVFDEFTGVKERSVVAVPVEESPTNSTLFNLGQKAPELLNHLGKDSPLHPGSRSA